MTDIILDTTIDNERWCRAINDVEGLINKVKDITFSYLLENENITILRSEKIKRISICLSDDAHIWALNKEFRGIDKPTNVLSFANIDFENFASENDIFSEIEIGDIIIALETLEREASLEKISLEDHFSHLLLHGFLHLCGYDHMDDEEAEYMENLEIKILAMLNIGNPYQEK